MRNEKRSREIRGMTQYGRESYYYYSLMHYNNNVVVLVGMEWKSSESASFGIVDHFREIHAISEKVENVTVDHLAASIIIFVEGIFWNVLSKSCPFVSWS